jgi:hypothetical protein
MRIKGEKGNLEVIKAAKPGLYVKDELEKFVEMG